MSGLTALLSAYAATLALRRKAPYRRLTTAFAIMGLLFVPYQFLPPVFHGAQCAGVRGHGVDIRRHVGGRRP
ncbi:hypothetical protein [Haloarcula marina]|uniref:hypothetical protein n=1 Tax=Haloarcula marina TaxID=2961574 RepID=UPI0020B7F0AB|nr:hypothetical protein [Halomicroarcula marina]